MPIRPLRHFSSVMAAPNESSRQMSMLTAFRWTRTHGLPPEVCGPASPLSLLLRASVRRHRRAQGGSTMHRSIRPKRARRPSDASADLLGGYPLGEGLDLLRLGDRRVLAKLAAQIAAQGDAAQGQTAVAARGGRSGGVRAAVAARL